jgi:hypothetical protein
MSTDTTLIKKYLNPQTGRWVKQGGAVYKDLVKRGVLSQQAPPRSKMSPAYKPPDQDSYRVPQQLADYPVDHSQTPWGQVKPIRKGDRRAVLADCGESCFLIPKDLKFPICKKTRPCEYSCRGLRAAKARAGEWKYTKVLERAKELSKRFDC